MKNQTIKQIMRSAFIAILPLIPVFFVLGSLLGALMNQAELSSMDAWINSLFVYAGASQFAMVDLLKSGTAFPAIILLTFVINLRHSLMVASMSPWLGDIKPGLAYSSVFFVTDESWAVSMREIRKNSGNIYFFLSATLPLYFVWSTSTVIGWYFGGYLPKTELFTQSINFLSIGFFIAILGLLYEGKQNIVPWVIASVASYFIYQYVSQTWYILLAGVLGAVYGLVFFSHKIIPSK